LAITTKHKISLHQKKTKENLKMNNSIKNRYEFVILYDVENGNPNGDPDAGNMPRIDPETGHGIVTDVCIKRKIRNWVDLTNAGKEGFKIYIKQDNVFLNDKAKVALETTKTIKDQTERSIAAQKYMCDTYYDIRTFGAVLTAFTKKGSGLWNSAGQVRGPVQIAFGKSVEPIRPQEVSITRLSISDAKEMKQAEAGQGEDGKSNTMGRKHIIPYGLYRQEGFISANLARKATGFSEDDLGVFWNAVIHMFDEDRSAARGKMSLRELIIFKHNNELGSAPAYKLFELVRVARRDGVEIPRAYSDYVINVDKAPDGVTIERRR
jgi:CRISPR-associated protein Csd2